MSDDLPEWEKRLRQEARNVELDVRSRKVPWNVYDALRSGRRYQRETLIDLATSRWFLVLVAAIVAIALIRAYWL